MFSLAVCTFGAAPLSHLAGIAVNRRNTTHISHQFNFLPPCGTCRSIRLVYYRQRERRPAEVPAERRRWRRAPREADGKEREYGNEREEEKEEREEMVEEEEKEEMEEGEED